MYIVYVSKYIIFLKFKLTCSGRKQNNDFLGTGHESRRGSRRSDYKGLQESFWANEYVVLNVVMDENKHM